MKPCEESIQKSFAAEMARLIVNKRKQRHMTQGELARLIGVHRNTLNRYEAGESEMPLWLLLRTADMLSCNHLLLLPGTRFVWGTDLVPMMRERDPRKGVRSERDPVVSFDEERKLRAMTA